MTPTHCPNCKVSLQGKEIPEKDQHLFGSTHFSRVIGIENVSIYDGIYKWRCPDCKHEWFRKPFTEADETRIK